MTWEITFYDEKLQNELFQLPVGILAKFLHYLERIEIHGANLGMPHTRPMGDGLFELRVKAEEGISRVYFIARLKVKKSCCSIISSKKQTKPLSAI
jgi:phage-related protein